MPQITSQDCPGNADRLVRGTAAGGFVRAFAVNATQTVQDACAAHGLEPFPAIALGQMLMAAQLMTCGSKDEGEELALLAAGDGPLRSVTAIANTKGQAKGYVGSFNKVRYMAESPASVGHALGSGSLTVVRSNPWMDPYVSQVELAPGQLGQTLTLYYLTSEQIPTHVAVEVLMDQGRVTAAGGYLIQLMPGYEDSLVDALAANVSKAGALEHMLADGISPEHLLERLLDGMDYAQTDVSAASFTCNCGYDRAWKTVSSLNTNELRSIIDDGQPITVNCDYCSSTYTITLEDLQELVNSRG